MTPEQEHARALLRVYRPGKVSDERVLESIKLVANGEGSVLLSASVETLYVAVQTGIPELAVRAEASVVRWGSS